MWCPIISPYRATAHSQPLNQRTLPSTTPQPPSLSLCRCIHICLLAVGERAHDLPLWGILGTWSHSSVRSIVLLQRRVTLLEKILADIFDIFNHHQPINQWPHLFQREREQGRETEGERKKGKQEEWERDAHVNTLALIRPDKRVEEPREREGLTLTCAERGLVSVPPLLYLISSVLAHCICHSSV